MADTSKTISRRAALAALFLLMLGAFTMAGLDNSKAAEPNETLIIKTQDKEITLRIEVARTPGEQAKGLMFRRSIADDAGMLFAYNGAQDIHMWMRNTYISLDMLFIAADGTVARIARNAEPFSEETISSGSKVTGVLEIGGGRAAALGIRSGDKIIHPHFKP